MKNRVIFYAAAFVLILAVCVFPLLRQGEAQIPQSESVASISKDDTFRINRASSNVQLVSSYTTVFDKNVQSRSFNIALACQSFCYLKVRKGEILSFNDTVGPRTESRGYKTAKVIENGEYVKGVGGGVCQVSSTLYNAWIGAGLSASKVQSHSLPSSYCALSRDATVSQFIDLVLVNDGDSDVVVNAVVSDGKVRFEIYGRPSGYEYRFETQILATVSPEQPLVEYVDSIEGGALSKQIKPSKCGYVSQLVRYVYKEGKLVSKNVLRKDVYHAVRGVVQKVKSEIAAP